MKRKHKVDQAALRKHLAEQVHFLRSSCRAYDGGDESEAKRIAVHLRVLLHDTARSRSLLSQLGGQFNWRFADTAYRFNPQNLLAHHGLITIKMTGGPAGDASFEPRCWSRTEVSPFIHFRLWWSSDVIFKDSEGERFTRKDVVLVVADQDGGAHVDPELDGAYAGLAKQGALGWRRAGGPWLADPVAPSLRQIAHEVLVTLEAAELVPREEAG